MAFWMFLTVFLIAADRITKYLAVLYLKPVYSHTLIKGVFQLVFVENEGAAFGLLPGSRWLFVPFTVVVCVIIVIYFFKGKNSNIIKLALVLVFAGALGNFFDRLFFGKVVDFLYFMPINFPVFNVADICVVAGTCLFSVIVLFFDRTPLETVKSIVMTPKMSKHIIEQVTKELTEEADIPEYPLKNAKEE